MRSDVVQGLLWLCIGVAITFFSSQYSMGTISQPGPGALPFGLGLVSMLLSIIHLFRSWRHGVSEQDQRLPFGSRWHKVLLIFLLMTLVTFLLESLGYLLSIFLLISIVMFIMEPRRWVSGMLLGFISSLASYALFDLWLKVPLPKGIFHFFGAAWMISLII
jgi:putative tricarboxylic transport membrane protein